MDQSFIPVNVSFQSLIEAVRYLEIDQVLELRKCLNNQIDLLERVELLAPSGLNFQPLRDALVAEDWEMATRMTIDLMKDAGMNDVSGGDTPIEEDDFFVPDGDVIHDMNIINYLWVRYSHGRFGFSVQKSVWERTGRSRDQLGELIGWRIGDRWIQEDELQFTKNAPLGHLPFVPYGLCLTSSYLEPENFTDEDGMGRSFSHLEAIKPIELWEILIDFIFDDLYSGS